MTDFSLTIDNEQRLLTWQVDLTPPHQRLRTPWGELWRGEEGGPGLVVWVEASEFFDLLMHYGTASYFEAVTPGRHRFVLTVLDSTDVA
jgi:hypothetical protein